MSSNPKLARCIAGLALTLATGAGYAIESYAHRPVRLVNPYPPGGAVDTACRAMADHLTKALGQSVVVEHRPGADSTIGTEAVVRAAPDGHTLLCNSSAIAIAPSFYPRLRYSPVRDLAAVVMVSETPVVLALNPSVPARSVGELIDLARSKPSSLSFASSGTGSSTHLSLELFKQLTRLDLAHVAPRAGSEPLLDLVAGQVQGVFNTTPTLMPHVNAGRLRALAIGSARRSEIAPELPTIAESGVVGYEASVWYGLFAPRGTPREIVETLNEEVNRMFADRETRELLFANGMSPLGGSTRAASSHFARETRRWSRVVRTANLNPRR